MALNRIIIMGRLTADAELRHTQNGKAVASFTVACNREGKDQATDFIDCVAWDKTAEFVSKYMSKGRVAVVEGRLQIRDWTDKDGNKRRNAEIKVERVFFGDSKKNDPIDDLARDLKQFAELSNESSLPF